MAALREYCEEHSKSLNEVITYHLGESLPLSPFESLKAKLVTHVGSLEGVKKVLQKKPKRGKPSDGTRDDCMLYDIARMMLGGKKDYAIAKALDITRMKVQWIQKRDALLLEKVQDQIRKQREQSSNTQARVRKAMEIRAALSAGTITKEQYDAEMKALADRMTPAMAKTS
jgi:hypothetical protein